jgi:thiol-disulfide isomerase/thioredoxin
MRTVFFVLSIIASAVACVANDSLPQAASIAGKVVGSDGRPASGMDVALYKPQTPSDPDSIAWRKTDANGRFGFEAVRPSFYKLLVVSSGFGITGQRLTVEAGQRVASLSFQLRPAERVSLRVVDAQAKPLAGAAIRTMTVRGEAGELTLDGIELLRMGISLRPSDSDGRLSLPPLPTRARVDLVVSCPRHAPAEIKDQPISVIKTTTLRLAAGGAIQIRLRPANGSAKLSSIDVFARQTEASDGPSTINRERFPLNARLEAELPLATGHYHVWLYDPKHVITPRYFDVPLSTNETRQLVFRCHPKVPVSGQVIDRHDGTPVGNVSVTALVADPDQSAESGSVFGPGWSRASATRTDAQGRFRLDLPEERVKLTFEGEAFDVEEPGVDLDIGPTTRTATIRIGIRRVPPVKGIVVDSSGTPVAGAIVRAAREFQHLTPVVTDEHGQFEIQLPWYPGASPPLSEGSVLNLLAFDPNRARSATLRLSIDRKTMASTVTALRLPLVSSAPESIVDMVPLPYEREDRSDHSSDVSPLIGKPAPELACQAWLNIDRTALRLADLRGKYVLLDFWTTWCGPCHRDFPLVQLARRFYGDRGLVVIGVHNNSVPVELIRAHAAKQRLDFPIAVDTADGRTVSAFNVSMFPTYVLIDPAGKVVQTSRDRGRPDLRLQMLEILRRDLLSASNPRETALPQK